MAPSKKSRLPESPFRTILIFEIRLKLTGNWLNLYMILVVNSCFFGGNFKSGVGKFPTETVGNSRLTAGNLLFLTFSVYYG